MPVPPPPDTVKEPPPGWRLRSAAAVVSAGSAVQLGVQLALQVFLARVFGAGDRMDAYVAAIAAPTAASALLHAVIGAVAVPALAEAERLRGVDGADRLATNLALALSAALSAAALAISTFAPAIVALLQPGFESSQRELTAELLRWQAWLVVANGLTALLTAWHQGRGRFLMPAVAGVVAVLLALVWCWLRAQSHGIVAVAQATVLGSFTGMALLAGSLALGGNWRRPSAWTNDARRLAVAAAPLVAVSFIAQADPLADRYFGSWLPAGSLSQLGYASRVVAALQLLTISSLSAAVFPRLAQHAAARRRGELQLDLQSAMRIVILWITPLAVALGLYGGPLIRDLFQRGEFGPEDTSAVASVLAASLGAIAACSLSEFLSKTLYALGLTRLPLAMTAAGIGLSLALKATLVSQLGLLALPLATSLGTTLIALLLWRAVAKRVGSPIPPGIGPTLARALAGSLVAAVVAYGILQSPIPLPAIAAAVAGLAAYGVALLVAGEPVVREALRRAPAGGTGG